MTNNFSVFQISADCVLFNFREFCLFHCANFDTCTSAALCSTRLATCNFSEDELIAKFARVSMSLKLPGIQYRQKVCHHEPAAAVVPGPESTSAVVVIASPPVPVSLVDVTESPRLVVPYTCMVVGEDVDETSDGSTTPAVVTPASPPFQHLNKQA